MELAAELGRPERVEVYDRAARELGEYWAAPLPDTTAPGTLISTERASEIMGVSQATIRGWGSRRNVPVWRYEHGWDPAELQEYRASQRRRRGRR